MLLTATKGFIWNSLQLNLYKQGHNLKGLKTDSNNNKKCMLYIAYTYWAII